MNILDFKRKAAGHVYREGDTAADRGYTAGANDEFIWVTQGSGDNEQLVQIPNPNYVKTKTPQEQAQEVVAAKLGVPISSVVWGGAGWVVDNGNGTGSTYNNSGEITNTFTPRKANEGGVFDKFFADLDRDLKLSENAPAILGIAALVLGQPYITELIASVGAEAAAAEMISSGVISAEAAAGAGLAAGELGLAGATAGAGNLAVAGAMGGTAAATTGANLAATSGLADFGLGDILSTTTAPTVGQGAVLTPAATAGTGAMGAGMGGAATTAAGEILGTGAAESGFTFSSLLRNPGENLGKALGISDPTLAKLAGNTIINTARNGGNVEEAAKNTAISYGLNLAGSTVSNAVKDVLKDIPQAELSDSVKEGITRGLTGAAVSIFQGKNPLNALAGAALNTAIKGVTDAMPGFKSLPLEAQNIAKASITAKLTGKSITNAALNAAMAEGKKSAAGYVDRTTGLSPEAKAISDAYKDPSRALDVVQPGTNTAADTTITGLQNNGLSEPNLSAETVADILGTNGEVQPGVVTAGLNTGVVSDAGGGGGRPFRADGGISGDNGGYGNTFPPGTEFANGLKHLGNGQWEDNGKFLGFVGSNVWAWPDANFGGKSPWNSTITKMGDPITISANEMGNPTISRSSTGSSESSGNLNDDEIEEIITGGQTNLGDTTSQEILDALGDASDTTQSDGVFTTGIKGDRGATGATGATGERGERGEAGASQTPEQIRDIVDAALAANPNLTEAQVTTAINAAIANIPAGISTADVSDAINAAIANIPAGLSIEEVTSIVTNSTKDLATKNDVNNAIANIQFPAGISKEDVAEQITNALAANPNLTADDVARSISDYMTANPGMTAADVGDVVTNATKDLATAKSVDDLKLDLTKAIDDAGKNNADAFDAIDKVIADLKAAGLTEQQVQDAVDLSVGGATKTLQDAIDAAVTGNTKALDDLQDQVAKDIGASETKVTGAISDAEKRLSDAVQAAKDIGLKGDEALQAGLDSVAADLGKSKEEVLTQLGKTEENLKKQFATDIGTVQKSVTDLEKTLVDTISANEKAGLTRDEATQKALTDIADQMGTDKADVLRQIGTTETNIAKKVTDLEDALGKKIEGTEEALATKLDDQGKAFMKALTDQGIDQKAAFDLALAAQTKLVTEGQETTQKALGDLSTAQQKEVADRVKAGETTDAAIAAVQLAVDTGQAATQAALNALSTAQQQEVADRVAAGETTNAAIAAVQTAVTEGQTDTNRRIDDLMAQGLTQYEATQQAILELSTGFTDQLTAAELARQTDREADLDAAAVQRITDQLERDDAAVATEQARQTEITNQKAREAANLKTIQTGQLRGQMQTGLQGLIGGLQQQATQMAAPAQVETVKATPGFDFRSPLNTGFFGGYESQKTPPKNKESLKIATGGYLDDLLEAIR